MFSRELSDVGRLKLKTVRDAQLINLDSIVLRLEGKQVFAALGNHSLLKAEARHLDLHRKRRLLIVNDQLVGSLLRQRVVQADWLFPCDGRL